MPKGATVAITGGTGLVGSRLAEALLASGNQVVVLTRDAAKAKVPPGVRAVGPTEWQGALAKATAVVNLAGEPIATRWSDAVKDRILRSRVETTRAVVEALRVLPPGSRPKVMVSASAIGYYGTSNTETFTEKSGPGSDFLARVCREWEAEAARLPEDVRQVVLRIGIVLAKDGGALGKMLPLFAIFAGGPLGSGRQWMSWVHRDDLVALIGAAIADTRYRGAYNATAPQPVRMSEFCSALGAAMGRPSWLPAPEPALKAVLGEGAVVVLEGQKVLPDRAQDTGFVFEYPDIAGAFKDIVK